MHSLTASGQLQAEAYACAVSDVYTFGPTFRSKKSRWAKYFDKSCIDCLRMVASAPFEPMTGGIDLESEHERCLTEVNQKPLIVYNYPQGIKAFYMRLTDDLETLAAADVHLVAKRVKGGSQREERFDLIKSRMEEMGLPFEPHEWYLDQGALEPGFGLGFDWMMLFATGMDNIRDVVPFPRYHGIADP
ncbi:hypothetical protein CUMW_189260 [Citrus unshiu]|nr:hypothetical protein CUMW_189260 [Citrus unshiu]